MELDDIIFHLGEANGGGPQAGSPPIYQSSNFTFNTLEAMQEALAKEDEIPFYTRGTNPTVQLLSKKIAALEGTEEALVFASGSAAIGAAVLNFVKAGDHLLSMANPYSWSKKLFTTWLPNYGIETSFFQDTETFDGLIRDQTRVVYLESPNSWTFEEVDIPAIVSVCQERGILTILDNSYATPLLQQGASLGIDLTVHSATKYLNGHSDVVAGVVCGSQKHIRNIFSGSFMTLGGVISPLDAWLLLRSLRTLPLRLERIRASTQEVVRFLQGSDKVKKMFYPKDALGTGLLTIDLNTEDPATVSLFCEQLKRFKLGPSWGSYDSLIFPAMATVGSLNYDNPNVVINRVRISVGLESANLLIEDLQEALMLL